MFGFGLPEIILVLVLLLVCFGPAKIPQVGSALGEAIRGFRRAANGEPVVINPQEERKRSA